MTVRDLTAQARMCLPSTFTDGARFRQMPVRARPGRLSTLIIAFPMVNRVCAAFLCGRAGRLTAQNGDFRPGQWELDYARATGPAPRPLERPALGADCPGPARRGCSHGLRALRSESSFLRRWFMAATAGRLPTDPFRPVLVRAVVPAARGLENQLTVFWGLAGAAAAAEVRVCLGSHRWPLGRRPPEEVSLLPLVAPRRRCAVLKAPSSLAGPAARDSQAAAATASLGPGDALVCASGLWRGAGAARLLEVGRAFMPWGRRWGPVQDLRRSTCYGIPL